MVGANRTPGKGETVFTAGERANDPSAVSARDVVRFRRSAVALARDGERGHALDAAEAIVSLATSGEEQILRGLLRPDPAAEAVAWTVACYQIGDLTPSALRDFSNACTAVGTLVACGEAHHVAAELVASTSTGLTWTPLTRVGEEIAFQLFAGDADPTAGSEQPGSSTAAEREAQRGWEDLLAQWQIEPDADLLLRAAGQHDPEDPAAPLESDPTVLSARVGALEAQLALLEARVRTLEDRSHGDLPLSAGPETSSPSAPG